jgi:hypothetical protein
MTDYVPLISRAVASLETSTEESRRALYERARNAQLATLRQPEFTASAIEDERLALEKAILEIESREVAKETTALPYCDAHSKEPTLTRDSPLASQSKRSGLFGITEGQGWAIWTLAAIIVMNGAGVAVILYILSYIMN